MTTINKPFAWKKFFMTGRIKIATRSKIKQIIKQLWWTIASDAYVQSIEYALIWERPANWKVDLLIKNWAKILNEADFQKIVDHYGIKL